MALFRLSSEIGGLICRQCEALYLAPALATTAAQSIEQIRYGTGKHFDPRWRKERGRKTFRFEFPDYNKLRKEASMDFDEMRTHMKKQGYQPPRSGPQERNITIGSTASIFEPYVPPEGDGVASVVSKEGAKQRLTEIEKKGKSYMQLRKIRQFEPDFESGAFADEALEIFKEAHNLLQNIEENEDRLHELVTERAYPEMAWGLDLSTFRWRFVESLEPPRTVHVRTTEMMSKDNLYAQVTVRLNTKQVLAIYDRFGRLMYGSEEVARDCLEYVVYEKHLADEYSRWRIHGKVVPDWMPPRQPVIRTLRKPSFNPIPDVEEETEGKQAEQTDTDTQPQLATA